jgi:hypothetical protein
LEALGATAAGEQVAFFGIGILSVFLVAESVDLSTKKLNAERGVRVAIAGLQSEVQMTEEDRVTIGTSVRVHVRAGHPFTPAQVPDAVRKYVRHVDGVAIAEVGQGDPIVLADTWETQSLLAVEEVVETETIRSGRLGFSGGLRTEGGVVGNAVTLTNAGFLVEQRALDLVDLPPAAGFGGELDLHAGRLNLVMARERFQRDESWTDLGRYLASLFTGRALEELTTGSLAPRGALDPPEVRRNLVIWSHSLQEGDRFADLKRELNHRIMATVPFPVAERTPSSLERLVESLPAPRLYFRRSGTPTQRPRHIDDEGFPVQLVEEVRDSIRVGALHARGFPVLETTYVSLMQETTGGASGQQLDESQVIAAALGGTGVQLVEIGAALDEDMDLLAVERLPVLRNVLDVGGLLRFARIPESGRRVVTDPSGIHYLNVNNPTVRRLLSAIPRAVSNPLRRKLLAAYLGVEDFKLSEARSILLELLEAEDLTAEAKTETAILSSSFVAEAIEELLKEGSE